MFCLASKAGLVTRTVGFYFLLEAIGCISPLTCFTVKTVSILIYSTIPPVLCQTYLLTGGCLSAT